ncbi:MAG TPA: signal recognition particle receptor subunit alpha, partial [Ktedonobacteraceae bacterium]|nr:signal recognition particle receptor subunit alpha [Ktedonobacteraceae bacterium]
MLNRFFGQKSQQAEPKKDSITAQEHIEGDSVSEKSINPFKNSLSRTRKLFGRLGDSFKQDNITDELWDELEEALLSADVGPSTTSWLMERLHQRVAEEQMHTGSQVQKALREELVALLDKPSPLRFAKQSPLTVILVIGVNGSGKTTSIAKLANRLKKEGHNVILAAGDTFRAAAIDQLKVWGERIGVPVI